MATFFSPLLTTLGKYSTAQLLIPPLLVAGSVGGANYAYKRYRAYFVRKPKVLDERAHRKLMQHNSFIDMMRKRHLRPHFRYEERDRMRQQQDLSEHVRRSEAARRRQSELDAQRQHQRIQDLRAQERMKSENYMNQLRERDQKRRMEAQRERSKWSPTNWFRGETDKRTGKRGRRGPFDDDGPSARPSSPLDYGSPDGYHNHPQGNPNGVNARGNGSSHRHHNGGRRSQR